MNLLLLQVVLARAAGLAAGKGAFVVAFASVDSGVSGKVAGGGEGALAGVADVFLLWGEGGSRGEGRRRKF